MNRNLSPIEYEGLEYIVSRLLAAHQRQQGIPPGIETRIHDIAERTSTGIHLSGWSSRYYIIENFAIQGIYLQDGTVILIGYRLAPGSEEPDERESPIYIDMTAFMDIEDFNLDYLIWKMEEHE